MNKQLEEALELEEEYKIFKSCYKYVRLGDTAQLLWKRLIQQQAKANMRKLSIKETASRDEKRDYLLAKAIYERILK